MTTPLRSSTLGCKHLLAAEGQQLARQVGGALGRPSRSPGRSAQCRVVGLEALQQASRNSRRSPISRLLKSCAMPPASRPTASIFWAWRSCCSKALFVGQELLQQSLKSRVQAQCGTLFLQQSSRIGRRLQPVTQIRKPHQPQSMFEIFFTPYAKGNPSRVRKPEMLFSEPFI